MMQPNWFDRELSTAMEKANAEQAMAEIAKSPRVVQAVAAALKDFDTGPKRMGPSRSQVIRGAVVEALTAD